MVARWRKATRCNKLWKNIRRNLYNERTGFNRVCLWNLGWCRIVKSRKVKLSKLSANRVQCPITSLLGAPTTHSRRSSCAPLWLCR